MPDTLSSSDIARIRAALVHPDGDKNLSLADAAEGCAKQIAYEIERVDVLTAENERLRAVVDRAVVVLPETAQVFIKHLTEQEAPDYNAHGWLSEMVALMDYAGELAVLGASATAALTAEKV